MDGVDCFGRPDHEACIAGYSVMFDFDSQRGQSHGSLQAEKGYDQIHFQSSFWVWVENGFLDGQEWKRETGINPGKR